MVKTFWDGKGLCSAEIHEINEVCPKCSKCILEADFRDRHGNIVCTGCPGCGAGYPTPIGVELYGAPLYKH